jgi:hypothetical protein
MEDLSKSELAAVVERAVDIEAELPRRTPAELQADEERRRRAEIREAAEVARQALRGVQWGVPALVGRKEPLPIRVQINSDGDSVVVYLTRSWDVLLTIEMEAADVPSNIDARELTPCEVAEQNRWLAVRLLDRDRGFEPVKRDDGTSWAYTRPTDDQVGTMEDDRVVFACSLLRVFGEIKQKAFIFGMALREQAEGNSEPSSGPRATLVVARSEPGTQRPS